MTTKKTKKTTSSKKGAKGRPAKKTSSRRPAKKSGRRGRGKGGANKSDFIRSLPNSMPARAVVEAGAKKGMKFSQQLVYNVRAGARQSNGVAKPKKLGPLGVPRKRHGKDEADFKQLVVGLGVTRAYDLIEEVEAKLRDAVG